MSVMFTGVLQWGRDLLIAEILDQPKSSSAALLLQWGRDLLIAEIDGPPRDERGRVGRFNGAAIF